MKIVVTAFEPFGRDTVNASAEALKLIKAPEGVELIRCILPVVYGKAAETVMKTVRKEKPDAVVCLGVAGGRDRITVEKIAINLNDGSIPDNDGIMLADRPIISEGPAAIFATIPVNDIVEAIKNTGTPVSVSYSAGAYVCNDLMYRVLYECSKYVPTVPAGFIHVPFTPGMAAERSEGEPSMPCETVARAVETAIETIRNSMEK